MENPRSSSGPLPEPFDVELGSTTSSPTSSTTSSPVSDRQVILNHNVHDLNVSDPQDYSNPAYFGSVYQVEPELNAFSLGEDNSFGLNPLFMQSSESNNAAQSQHPCSVYSRRFRDPSQAIRNSDPYVSTGIQDVGSSSSQSSGTPLSPFVEAARSSSKRRSGDGSINHSSSSNSGIQIADSSARNPTAPAHRNPGSSLDVPRSHDIPEPVSESSQTNIMANINPSIQQEALTPEGSSAGRIVGRPIPMESPQHSIFNFVDEIEHSDNEWSQMYEVPRNLHPVQQNSGSDSLGSSSTERNAATAVAASSTERNGVRSNRRSPGEMRSICDELVRRLAALRSAIGDLRPSTGVSSPDPSPVQAGPPFTSSVEIRRVLGSLTPAERARIRTEMRNILNAARARRDTLVEGARRSAQIARSAVAIRDHYRDMRADVDNMSYEELLALEARIGNAETGLSEEIITSGLKRQKLMIKEAQDAETCCVCQAEYEGGEELGTLVCGHYFHSECIKPWLKMKNLCPICKSTGLKSLDATRNPTR